MVSPPDRCAFARLVSYRVAHNSVSRQKLISRDYVLMLLPLYGVFALLLYATVQIQQQLGLSPGSSFAAPRSGGTTTRHPLVPAAAARFIQPVGECEAKVSFILENLSKDYWPVPADSRYVSNSKVIEGFRLLGRRLQYFFVAAGFEASNHPQHGFAQLVVPRDSFGLAACFGCSA